MDAAAVAMAHYRRQVALSRRLAAEVARIWRTMDRDFIDVWWAGSSDRLLAAVTGGQLLAARDADGYLTQVLTAQGIDPASSGEVNARAFAGVASDGRPLDDLLRQPVITTKTAIGRGESPTRATLAGGVQLDMIVRTQLADAGRTAVGVALSARPHATGYVRMLSPPSCARCIILAGRTYKWNKGFQRHPRCDCRHIPTAENADGDVVTNPHAYIDSLTRAEREHILGKAGAQAVEDGADLNQVVNAWRGMQTASVHGQQVQITTEGATRRGLAGQRLGARRGEHAVRLMPEQIYADAERLGLTRDQTLDVLRRHGYIF